MFEHFVIVYAVTREREFNVYFKENDGPGQIKSLYHVISNHSAIKRTSMS